MQNSCVFCKKDSGQYYDEIIEETQYFWIKPAVGSLVRGYLLIISKRHIFSMKELTKDEQKEYAEVLEKYRQKFLKCYHHYPIIFEHGAGREEKALTAGSVIHAHTHIVNYQFQNEKEILTSYQFQRKTQENLSQKRIYHVYESRWHLL